MEQRGGWAIGSFVALGAWIAGMLLQFHPIILSGLSRMQSDWGDTRLNNYILEHGYRWLVGMPGHERFWSPPVFFPAPNTAAYSDVLLGVAPLYWLWRLIGLQPDTAFQLWLLTLGTLNFLSALLLFSRGFRCRPIASAVGALLLSFAAVRTAQVMHAQLIAHFYLVLAILALLQIFEPVPEIRAGVAIVERRTAWVLALALACVAQVYSSFYYGWYLCFAMLLGAIWAVAMPGTRRRFLTTVRANLRAMLVATLGAALLLAPLANHYLQAEHQVGTRKFIVVETMLPRLQSWAYQGPDSWLYGWLATHDAFHYLPMEHEQRLGLGLATVVCAASGLWMGRRRRAVQFAVLIPVTMAILATQWPGGFAPWRAIYLFVPGAAALRAVSRIGVALVLPAALGVALLADAIIRPRRIPPSRAATSLRRRDLRTRALLATLLIAVVVAEQVQQPEWYDKNAGRARVARVANGIGADCGAFLYTPTGGSDDPWHYHTDAMWASMLRSVPTLNGYSGNQPPNWAFYDNRVPTQGLDSVVTASVSRWAAQWHMDPARICRVRMEPSVQ